MKKRVVIEALNPLHGNVNYYKELKELSRRNRNKPTESEDIIWKEVLMKKKTGFKFLRQKPIYRFILDFYCSELNLAIEIDGSSHDMKKGIDWERDLFMQQIGIKTIRFSNEEVLNEINKVKKRIENCISDLQVSLVKGRFRGVRG
jgi:very-short-patch-repair endonuclease